MAWAIGAQCSGNAGSGQRPIRVIQPALRSWNTLLPWCTAGQAGAEASGGCTTGEFEMVDRAAFRQACQSLLSREWLLFSSSNGRLAAVEQLTRIKAGTSKS